jgi:signal transduction histidine kinase
MTAPDGSSNVSGSASKGNASAQSSSAMKSGKRQSTDDQFVATSTYIVDSAGAVTQTINDPLSLDSTTLATAIEQALQAQANAGGSDTRGTISSLNLYFRVGTSNSGSTMVSFASGNYVDQTMLSLLGTLGLVSIVALAAFFVISLFLSRWALKPVERAWRQQQQFVADASHELKTPLTVIIANNSILKSMPDQTIDSQLQWIESTDTEAHLMQGLVNDMLYLAQPEDTERVVTCGTVDFSDMVCSSTLQFESVAFEKGVSIEDDIEDGIVLEGDSARIQRLISTLLDNACKYVNEGGTVKVSLRRVGAKCQFAVNNTGPVVDSEDLPHLFDRFYRTDKARTRGKGGFGLGLSIAKSVVDEQGGTIAATSTAQDGTTFAVDLPLQK